MPECILVIQTGGTIDKDYPHQQDGYAFTIGDSATEKLLRQMDLSVAFEYVSCAQKDSLDLTDDDRQEIVQAITAYKDHQKIIITHGTDTLQQTGLYIKKRVEGKVIILTGAMRPAAFIDSDARFNVGMAVGATQTLDAGVYICLHGITKEVSAIQRDAQSGKYY